MAQRLRAQVRAGVDEDAVASARLDAGSTAAAGVSRGSVERQVVALAADHRHAVRRAGAEKRDLSRDTLSGLAESGLDDALLALLGLDEAHPQLVEQIVHELALRARRGCPRVFSWSMRDDLDHLPRGHEIRLGGLAGPGSAMSPKCTAAVVASESMKLVKEMPDSS